MSKLKVQVASDRIIPVFGDVVPLFLGTKGMKTINYINNRFGTYGMQDEMGEGMWQVWGEKRNKYRVSVGKP